MIDFGGGDFPNGTPFDLQHFRYLLCGNMSELCEIAEMNVNGIWLRGGKDVERINDGK